MYQILFPAQLNQVSWLFTGGIKDATTNADLDLSIYTWTLEILEQDSTCVRLTASTQNGKFTTPELGIFQFSFTVDEMKTLCPGSYPIRLTMALGTDSIGLSVGALPVVDR